MIDYCAFSNEHKCIKWLDYQLTKHKLEEAEELCHLNWVEIQRQQEYIDILKNILKQHDIDVPKGVF